MQLILKHFNIVFLSVKKKKEQLSCQQLRKSAAEYKSMVSFSALVFPLTGEEKLWRHVLFSVWLIPAVLSGV